MMKNAFIFCGLLILLGSCGSNSNTTKENAAEPVTSQKEKKSEVITGTPDAANNCASSKLEVHVKDANESGTNIRKSPSGEVLLTLVESDEDSKYSFNITESRDGWFKIENPISGMERDIEIPDGEGWIHSSVIAVNTRNYGGQDLNLLENYENGKVVGVIKEESYGLRIKELCGSWVKVDYNGTVGWIEADWLCGNPWTTCS